MPKTSGAVLAAGAPSITLTTPASAPSSCMPAHPASRYVSCPSPHATILGRGRELPCDTRRTGLNNNVLVIGPSGAGKTRHVLKPNLLQMSSSFVVLDTKGTLCREVGPVLAQHGYDVQRLDFTTICGPAAAPIEGVRDVGYNPLAFIRYYNVDADGTAQHGRGPGRGGQRVPDQQDILSIANALCPIENTADPFWDRAAANLLSCLIAFVAERLPAKERCFASVIMLANHLNDEATFKLLDELKITAPHSMASVQYQRYAPTREAEKMHASIIGIIAEKLMALGLDGALRMYQKEEQVDFTRLGHERVALFVTTSDIDRALDPLASLFCSQAFATLMREADACPNGALPQPVRFLLDDFANLTIPNVDDVLAVARSRNMWITLLLQSYNQLEARYGRARAMSIMGNCDVHQVLGFQDVDTAQCYADRADKTLRTLLETPAGRWWVFVRGQRAELVDGFRLEEHPRYVEMPEAYAADLAPLADSADAPQGEAWVAGDSGACPMAMPEAGLPSSR